MGVSVYERMYVERVKVSFFFSFVFVIKDKPGLLVAKIFWRKKNVNNVTEEWCTENVELLQK